MTMNFLDATGLAHFWAKVKAHVLQNGIFYGTCSTGGGTVAKVATVTGVTELKTGLTVAIKFTAANTAANPTLNVNSLGAKAIKRYGTTAPSTSAASSWNANSVVTLTYDGTYWMLHDWNNTTYSSMTVAEYEAGTGTTARTITPERLKGAIQHWDAVTSVNGNTGAVTISVPTKTSELTNDSQFVSAIDLSDNLFSTLYYLNVSGSTASLVNASSAPISIASLAAAFRSVSGVQIAQVFNVSGSNFKLRMYDIVDGDTINGTVRLVAVEGSTVYIADLTDAGSGLTGTISTTTMLTSETDPTVPSWAKAASKPTYTASEVGALATTGGDIEGDITLKAAAGQSSPSLIFQRGTLTDNYNDWLIQDRGGYLYFDQRGNGSTAWSNQMWIDTTGGVHATTFSGYTLAGACAKSVDTSISAGSTSANLPTSQAVASFVEGKGYITSAPVSSVNGNTGAVTVRELPAVTSSDNGKVLRVVSGAWSAVSLPSASGVSF